MDKDEFDVPTTRDVGASRRTVLRGVLDGAASAAFLAAGWTIRAAHAQETTPAASPLGAEGPVKIVILFGQPTDSAAFEDYYLGTHVPLALQIPLFQRLEAGQAVSALDGGEPAFYRIAEMYFANRADMEAALASPEGQEAFADVANFATGGVTASIVSDIQTITGQEGDATPAT